MSPERARAHRAVRLVAERHQSHADLVQQIKDAVSLKPKNLKISDLNWRFAVRSVLRGQNLLILGESGFGKTMLATLLPEVLDRPFFKIPMGHSNDPKSLLIGNTHFAKDTGTFVVDAPFVTAIQTPNAIILLDELSRAHPSAHNILMPVLDAKQRELVLDSRPDTPTIKVADGVCFVATANVGSDYTATRSLDRALLDRFATLLMPMLGKDDEIDLLSDLYPYVSKAAIVAIAEIAEYTRNEVTSDTPKIDTQISTRITVDMCGLIHDGFTLAEAAEVFIYPFYPEAGGTRTLMRQMVQQYIDDPTTAKKASPFANPSTDPNRGVTSPFP